MSVMLLFGRKVLLLWSGRSHLVTSLIANMRYSLWIGLIANMRSGLVTGLITNMRFGLATLLGSHKSRNNAPYPR